MTNDELRTILAVAGLSTKLKGDETLVEVCIFCSNPKWNLELNAAKGVFRCWACRTGGRLDRFLEQVTGERYRIRPAIAREKVAAARPQGDRQEPFSSKPVAEVQSAADYLATRGYTPDVCREFGLTVCLEEGHQMYGRIVIPIRDYWSGQVLGWTGRSYTNQWPKYWSMLPSMEITGWRAPGKMTPAVVVEGHLDGIAVRRAGFSAAVLGGIGMRDVGEWVVRLQPEQWCVVMLDGDALEAGEQLYWNIARYHPWSRIGMVKLRPDADPASLGPDAVKQRIKAAISAVDGTYQDGGEFLVE